MPLPGISTDQLSSKEVPEAPTSTVVVRPAKIVDGVTLESDIGVGPGPAGPSGPCGPCGPVGPLSAQPTTTKMRLARATRERAHITGGRSTVASAKSKVEDLELSA